MRPPAFAIAWQKLVNPEQTGLPARHESAITKMQLRRWGETKKRLKAVDRPCRTWSPRLPSRRSSKSPSRKWPLAGDIRERDTPFQAGERKGIERGANARIAAEVLPFRFERLKQAKLALALLWEGLKASQWLD